MLSWSRVRNRRAYCGGCDAILARETPVRVLHLPGGIQKIRCTTCAGERAPDDLPALPLPPPPVMPPRRPVDMTPIGALAFDFMRSREPGEDDEP